jgi:ATP-binding cassette subfamily B multidrug efflux pump
MSEEKQEQFIKEDLITTKIGYIDLFRRLWPYARKHRLLFAMVIFSVVGLAVISRALPQLIGYIIDHALPNKDMALFVQIAMIYLCLEVLKSIFSFSHNFFFSRLGNRVLFYLRNDLLTHVQKLPIDYFNKTPAGRTVTRITNDVMALGELFTEGIITIFTQSVILVAIVVWLFFISWKMSLVLLIFSPFFIYLSIYVSNRIKVILTDQKKKLSAMNSFFAENLNGIKVVQLYNRIRYNRKMLTVISDDYLKLSYKSTAAYALLQPIMNLFNAFTITGALYLGGYFHAQGALTIGSMVAFLLHIQDFIPPLREILEKYQQFQNSITSAERIFTLMDEKEENTRHESPVTRAPSIFAAEQFKGKIELRNLTFQYSDAGPAVLKNISLTISPGQSVALVGRTGSGKSTLVTLLQRFYNPPEQTLFIDNQCINSIPLQQLRKLIGVIQQDPFIFKGTIYENICLSNQEIDETQVRKACERIGYLQLLKDSGRDLNTPLEERGANLSLGERQLVCMARIFAFNPAILIMDEATANIDSVTENLIQRATDELTRNRTTIIVAHRLSTIEKCDQIAVLDQGSLVEIGTHDELMQKEEYYAQLHRHGQERPQSSNIGQSNTKAL